MKEKTNGRMSRSEALGILGRMAQRREATLDEVRALQVAVRCVAKRMFDTERHFKRKREAGRTEGARQDAAPPEAEVAVMAERVRAVAVRMRELGKKATADQIAMGPGALMLWLEGFASRLDQAVGDDPTPWTPYEGELEIVHLPKREKGGEA